MEIFAQTVLLAAAGYAFVYLLAGGGVFFIAKMLGK